MEKKAAGNLISGEVYMMFYAVVIMQSGQYPVLLIKPNHNIMEVIGLYLMKELPKETSVRHTTPVHCWRHIMCHVSRSFIIFCLMTAKSMPQPQLNSVKESLNSYKT